jgi:hypothetical protein
MVVEDIGYMLFVQLLGMTEYPGAPFTANIVKDLILFLFVPMVFIIAVVYMLTMRVFPETYSKMRLLFGIAAFLVIVVSGYYKMFAYIAGVYFVFLIIIMGLLFFLLRHFRGGGGGMPLGGSFKNSVDGMPDDVKKSRLELEKELKKTENDIKEAKSKLNNAEGKGDHLATFYAQQVSMFEEKKETLRKRLYPWEKYA